MNALRSQLYGACTAKTSMENNRPSSIYGTECAYVSAEIIRRYANAGCKNPNHYKQLPLSIQPVTSNKPGNVFYDCYTNK